MRHENHDAPRFQKEVEESEVIPKGPLGALGPHRPHKNRTLSLSEAIEDEDIVLEPMEPKTTTLDDDDGDIEYETIVPEVPTGAFREELLLLYREFLDSADAENFVEGVLDIDTGDPTRIAAVVIAVEASLDRKNEDRELTSLLLLKLSESAVKGNLMERAFEILLGMIEEFQIDSPEAPIHLAHFIARAVADEVLHPRFVADHMDVVSSTAREVMAIAKGLVSMRHGLPWLCKIWGVGGGHQPLSELIAAIQSMLQEYILSEDLSEAERRVRELDVPHFNHEIVFEALQLCLEGNQKKTLLLNGLLAALSRSGVITETQMIAGFARIKRLLADLQKDIPGAEDRFPEIARRASRAGFLPASALHSLA